MARRAQNGEVNKSQEIRDLFTQNPEIKVKDIIETLSGRGIYVKPGLVYLVKGKMSGIKKRRRRGRRRADSAVAAAGVAVAATDVLTTVKKVKDLAASVGGMKKLKALIEALE